MDNINVIEPNGKLGVVIVGLGGAVSTTFITGTLCARKGLALPIGSITQLATIRLGKREENRFPKIKDVVPLASLDELVFGGWDIFPDNVYEVAMHAEVRKKSDLDLVKDELELIKPMRALFEKDYVKRLEGSWVISGDTKWEKMLQIREDIKEFKAKNDCKRVVVIWCASTETYMPLSDAHADLAKFEEAMKSNSHDIAPSMCYAYAALSEGAPFIMGAPNLTVDIPAMWELSDILNLPIAGKDFKTGQTMMKTVIAPALKTRMLGLEGWFSTNILGNRDGEVLDDPDSFKTKEVSKLSVIESILQPDLYPELYGDVYHKVRINYYPPRKVNKEGWDNLDIFGWMHYPMQLKIDFLCRDSILAAPLCLDLVLLMDLAKRCGFSGIQYWLSFYFKSPMHKPDVVPENDLCIEYTKFKNILRTILCEAPVDYL